MSKKDFQFSIPEESPGFLLWQVTNLWQREIKLALTDFELTHAQFVLLASLHWHIKNKQSVTQAMLSKHTHVDQMTTSTVLRTLQSKGLIRRTESDKDTRAKAVEITTAGKRIIVPAINAVEEFDKRFFKTLEKQANKFNTSLLELIESNRSKE